MENDMSVYKKQLKDLLIEKRKFKDLISDIEKEFIFMKERLNIFERQANFLLRYCYIDEIEEFIEKLSDDYDTNQKKKILY